jgi:hypothetical protein
LKRFLKRLLDNLQGEASNPKAGASEECANVSFFHRQPFKCFVRGSCKTPRGMGVPPMKHGQDARATPASKGFRKNLKPILNKPFTSPLLPDKALAIQKITAFVWFSKLQQSTKRKR